MKKFVVIFCMMAVAAVGCSSSRNSQKQYDSEAITKMEYKAYTRGSNKQVIIIRDKVEVKELRQGKNIEASYPLSKDNWNKLVAMAQRINIKKMDALEAPTKKHQYDGAMAANITITAGSTTYRSVTFDDDNPPTEIKVLVDEITGISGVGKIQVEE